MMLTTAGDRESRRHDIAVQPPPHFGTDLSR